MDIHTATEQAFKNGYDKGQHDAAEKILNDIAHIRVNYNVTATIIAFQITEKIEELAKQYNVEVKDVQNT